MLVRAGTMRRWSWSSFGLWLVVALLTPTAEARAQDLTADRVRFALDRTDERIALAQSLVTGAKNAPTVVSSTAANAIWGVRRWVKRTSDLMSR